MIVPKLPAADTKQVQPSSFGILRIFSADGPVPARKYVGRNVKNTRRVFYEKDTPDNGIIISNQQ